MASTNASLRDACRVLEKEVEKCKAELDAFQNQLKAEDLAQSFRQIHLGNKSEVVALETLKHKMAILQSENKAMEKNYSLNPNELSVLTNMARSWQTKTAEELQELLVKEKIKQTKLQEAVVRKELIIRENRKLCEVLQKEKDSLLNQHSELENQKMKDLEEKLAKVRKMYNEMKVHLKDTVETYFPDPKIPGYIGMYSLLNELTQRLQNRERDTYVTIQNTMWPYYLEILEKHGIVERHPTDYQKIRMVDFSDGRLGT